MNPHMPGNQDGKYKTRYTMKKQLLGNIIVLVFTAHM